MQTAVVDYIFEQLEENSLFFRGTDNELNISISASDYLDLKRLAKAIFEKQIIEAFDEGQEYEYQYHINNAPKFYSETYFAETYGSKGSDEIGSSLEWNGESTEGHNIHTSSQTEISDEEIEKYANELYYGTNFKQVCITACKWYREQLKQRQ